MSQVQPPQRRQAGTRCGRSLPRGSLRMGRAAPEQKSLVHRWRLTRKDKAGARGGGRSCRGEGGLEQNQAAPTWRLQSRRQNMSMGGHGHSGQGRAKAHRSQTHEAWTCQQASPPRQGLCWSSNGPAVPRQALLLVTGTAQSAHRRSTPRPVLQPAGDASPALLPASACCLAATCAETEAGSSVMASMMRQVRLRI